MSPRLVVCHCDPTWLALACCEVCEGRELRVLLERRGAVATGHPSDEAFDELVASYHADSFDRAAAAAPGRDG